MQPHFKQRKSKSKGKRVKAVLVTSIVQQEHLWVRSSSGLPSFSHSLHHSEFLCSVNETRSFYVKRMCLISSGS